MRNDHQLSRNELFVIIVITLAILVSGVVLYNAGYNESFYSDNPQVRSVFEVLTELGNDIVYLLLISLAFMAYDKRFARRLCYLFFFMVYVTYFLKEFFHDPRPASNLERDDPSMGYGFPSGHTTTSIAFYGYIMLSHLGEARARWPLMLFCGFAIVVVPISRLVIGAHDLQDVVGAAVISLSILVAYMVLQPRVSRVVVSWPLEKQVGVGVVAALLLWAIGALVLAARHPGELGTALEETGRGAGLLLGCAIAFPLEEAFVGYRPDLMATKQRVMAALIGLPIIIVAYIAIKETIDLLLPVYVADLVTYSVLILVLALLVPYLLMRFVVASGSATSKDGS